MKYFLQMKLLILILCFMAISLISSTKLFRGHKSHHKTHFLDNEKWKDYYAAIRTSYGINDLTSKRFCELNTEWNNYIGALLYSNLPNSPNPPEQVEPQTCKYIWLFTFKENQIKSYINSCLQQSGKIERTPERFTNVKTFIEELKKELKFSGNNCNGDLFPILEEGEGDLNLIRCAQFPSQDKIKINQHLIAKSFVSASVGVDLSCGSATKLHFKISGDKKRAFGRYVEKFSKDRKNEFLILPGSCFSKLVKEADNEFYFEGTGSENCINALEM